MPPSGSASSCSSAGPCGPTYRVKGARSGPVTDALLRSLLSRKVATEVRTTSQGWGRSGRGHPRSRTAVAQAAVYAPNPVMDAR